MRRKNVAQVQELKLAISLLNQAVQSLERSGEPMLAQRLANVRMGIDLRVALATGQGAV